VQIAFKLLRKYRSVDNICMDNIMTDYVNNVINEPLEPQGLLDMD
jgi:hypothetical protein